MINRCAVVGALALILAGCVSFPGALPVIAAPSIDGDAVISVDGARLGLTLWKADHPVAAIVAVHGMNDYAGAFAYAGPYWAERGISVYAYDQRGFGRSPEFGLWAGEGAMKQDLFAVVSAVRAAAPNLPLYVVGHSMGSAVILAAMEEGPIDVAGAVLAAPGVWGGASMSIFYRGALNIAAALAPGKTLTGEAAGRQASDNVDFLRAMYQDPHVIKETRLDSILGAERLMGDAYDAADEVGGHILFLYGENDEIIPLKALRKTAARLCGDVSTIAYPDGWHLIFADLDREKPLGDVANWILAGQMRRPQVGMGNPGPAVSNCTGGDDGFAPSAFSSAPDVAAMHPGAG